MVCGWKVLYGLPGKRLICVSGGGLLAGLTTVLAWNINVIAGVTTIIL